MDQTSQQQHAPPAVVRLRVLSKLLRLFLSAMGGRRSLEVPHGDVTILSEVVLEKAPLSLNNPGSPLKPTSGLEVCTSITNGTTKGPLC